MTEEDLQLKEIVAPSLTDVNYGANIRDKFSNINDNFHKVANRDFVKGDAGADLLTISLPFEDDLLTAVNSAFVEKYGDDVLADINIVKSTGTTTYTWKDCLADSDLLVVYKLIDPLAEDEEANREYLHSAFIYVLLDNRFSADVIKLFEDDYSSTYQNIKDVSSVLYFNYNNGWSCDIVEAFPTLYFDTDSSCFKWKFYGKESGIRATGVQGDPGHNAPILIGKVSKDAIQDSLTVTTSTYLSLTAVWDKDHWNKNYDVDDIDDGDPVLAMFDADDSDDSNEAKQTLFVSAITKLDTGDCRVAYSGNQTISIIALNDALEQALKNIGTAEAAKGLFIPFYTNSLDAHMLYNYKEGSVYKLRVKPVADYSNTSVSSSESTQLDLAYPIVSIGLSGQIGVSNDEVSIKHPTQIDNTLTVNDATTIGGNLTVGGNFTAEKSAEILQDLTVDGDADISGDVSITGEFSAYGGDIHAYKNQVGSPERVDIKTGVIDIEAQYGVTVLGSQGTVIGSTSSSETYINGKNVCITGATITFNGGPNNRIPLLTAGTAASADDLLTITLTPQTAGYHALVQALTTHDQILLQFYGYKATDIIDLTIHRETNNNNGKLYIPIHNTNSGATFSSINQKKTDKYMIYVNGDTYYNYTYTENGKSSTYSSLPVRIMWAAGGSSLG